jgi:uncharacterized protein (TIGR02646 family)
MRKIEKNINMIPLSLIPAFPDLFLGVDKIPLSSRNTHQKRMFIIEQEKYIDTDDYNKRYKYADVKEALKDLYKHKCAFCEQKIEQFQVEHYRPKSLYYWLAFSWDNLIVACPRCNQNKGINFELFGNKIEFKNIEPNIRNINTISSSYDLKEQPKMVNPEVTDPAGKIQFERNGFIKSDDERFTYTIKMCAIDSKYLNDERRKLLDIFTRDILSALTDSSDPTKQLIKIETIVEKFIADSQDVDLPFLAFRRYAITSGLISEIIKQLTRKII